MGDWLRKPGRTSAHLVPEAPPRGEGFDFDLTKKDGHLLTSIAFHLPSYKGLGTTRHCPKAAVYLTRLTNVSSALGEAWMLSAGPSNIGSVDRDHHEEVASEVPGAVG